METKLYLILVAAMLVAPPEASSQDGNKIWEFTTGGAINGAPALGSDGTIYFGSMNGKVYALNPSGARQWEYTTQAGINASPALDADGNIYVGSLDAKLYSLTPSGTLRWTLATAAPVYSSPAVAPDGTIYFGSLDGNLYAVAASGAKKWQFATRGGIFSSPAVAEDGTIYVGSRDNKLYALNADGTQRWEGATGSWIDSSPAIGPDGRVFVGSRDARVYAFEKTGQKVWEFIAGGSVYSSPVIGPDGAIYVGSLDGRLHALNRDGAERWSAPTTNRVVYSSPALAADGTVFVGCQDNNLYAFNSDGSQKWTFASPASFDSSSVALGRDGTVYIGAADGKLYALKGSSGPNSGPWPLFRRDPRHTASGFVLRTLPANYVAGAKITVTLHCFPPKNSGFYAVEDMPPLNWSVGEISDGGVFDSSGQKVKFGPFLDGRERLLTYEVTPPLTESGAKQFVATSFLQGAEALVGGDQMASPLTLHPADENGVDAWMTIGEVTAYGAAWKIGTTWPVGPNPVPLNYLSRAVALWKNGETYSLLTNFISAPAWWVNVTGDLAHRNLPHGPVLLPRSITNGAAAADLPRNYSPNVPFTAAIEVTPSTNVVVYAVEDQPPTGWAVSQISEGGGWDPIQQKVKWGPFFDHDPRTLTYRVTPPATAGDDGGFNGVAAFDGAAVSIGGRRQILSTAHQNAFVERELPVSYAAQARILVTLNVHPPAGTTFYVIEDTPPASWAVDMINNNGSLDSTKGVVRFGPFFDDVPRMLTYVVIPAASSSAPADFSGVVATTEPPEIAITGDATLRLVPLHPADDGPVDGWMTIGEMTAYGAAWKRGLAWPLEPNPIPPAYLEGAVVLWRGGEEYRFEANLPNSSLPWVNLGMGEFSPDKYPQGVFPTPSSTNTSAVATIPLTFQPGVPLTVTVAVTPASDVVTYAVEDIPPSNWIVSQISDQGFYDTHRQKVKWGPFFDAAARTLTYRATPPADATATVEFIGLAAFNDATELIAGERTSGPAGREGHVALGLPQLLTGGAVHLTVIATSGAPYVIQASANLTEWTPITVELSGNKVWQDLQATNFSQRFYRVVNHY